MGVGMYPSLMGSFSFPAPSSGEASSSLCSVSFRTTHMKDPWILPTPSPSCAPIETDVPLAAAMIEYQANLECVAEPDPSSS